MDTGPRDSKIDSETPAVRHDGAYLPHIQTVSQLHVHMLQVSLLHSRLLVHALRAISLTRLVPVNTPPTSSVTPMRLLKQL